MMKSALTPLLPVRRILPVLALTLAFVHATAAAPVDSNPPPGWWKDATFYEVFVRSFADAGSGPLARDGVGDLQGLIDHLDYLNDGRGAAGASLGVNALWLMPVQPSPSYHGYDVTDYFNVNPQYGDVALMKRLVQEAHRRGIRVIIDLVLNHCSSAHPLFRAAVAAGPGGKEDARKLFRFAALPEQLSGPWSQRVWHPAHQEFYYGVFGADMPDWNLRTAAATEHHRRTAEFWLREVGVDGFRLDAVRYLVESGEDLQDTEETRQWLREFTAYCHQLKPGAFVIGENTASMREVARCVNGASLDSAFEFDLEKATLEAIRLDTPGILMLALGWLHGLYGENSPWATIISNHDQERVVTQLNGDQAGTRLAAELLFTLPGVPFVYYGEELGMTGAKPDPELRTPMPWTPDAATAGFTATGVKPWHRVTGDVTRVNVRSEEADRNSLLNLYRRLIQMNTSSAALRHGRPVTISSSDRDVYVAMRQTDRDAVLIVGNFDAAPRRGPSLSVASSEIRPSWTTAEILQSAPLVTPAVSPEGGFKDWTPMAELAPRSVYVIRWTKP